MYLISILEEFLIYNEHKRNGFYNMFSVLIDFKRNNI